MERQRSRVGLFLRSNPALTSKGEKLGGGMEEEEEEGGLFLYTDSLSLSVSHLNPSLFCLLLLMWAVG